MERQRKLAPAKSLKGETTRLLDTAGGRSVREQDLRRDAHELVRQATEDRYDSGAIYELLVPSVRTRLNPQSNKTQKELAKAIMDDVTSYAGKQEVLVKSFVPLEIADDPLGPFPFLHVLEESRVIELRQRMNGANIHTSDFWEQILTSMLELSENRSAINRLQIYTSRNSLVHSGVVESVLSIKPDSIGGRATSLTSDKILTQIIEEARKPVESGGPSVRPDIYNAHFGGTSLHEIIEQPFSDEYTKKVLQYVAGMPKGNLFWQSLVKNLFFEERDLGDIEPGQLEFREHTAKVIAFQMKLTSELLGPVLAREDGNPMATTFDREIRQALSSIYPYFYSTLTKMLFKTAQRAPGKLQEISQELGPEAIEGIYQFTQVISERDREESPKIVARRLINSWSDIKSDWQRRLMISEKGMTNAQISRQKAGIEELTSAMEQEITSDYAKFFASPDSAGYYMGISHERRYADFINTVNQQDTTANELLPKELLEELGVEGGNSYKFYSLKIQPTNPLITLLGYTIITLSIPSVVGNPVIFGLLGENKDNAISGALEYNGTLRDVFTKNGVKPELLQSIIAAAYIQILQREKATNNPALMRPVTDFEPPILTPDETSQNITGEEADSLMKQAFGDIFEE